MNQSPKILLRLNSECNISKAMCYEFISDNPISISLCNIPEFIGEVNCDCGNKAIFLVNDEIYKCSSCASNLIPESKLINNESISYPITIKSVKDLRFEWSPNDGIKWYNLWGRNIETKKWKYVLNIIKDMVLNKSEVEIDGEYIQDKKRMIIS